MPIESQSGNGGLERTAVPGSQWTACCWLKVVNTTTAWFGLITFGYGSGTGWAGLWRDNNAGGLDLSMLSSSGTDDINFDQVVEDEWSFVAITVDGTGGSALTCYHRLEGESALTNSASTGIFTNTSTEFYFCNSPFGEELQGDNCYHKVWDTVLTADEILMESYFIQPVTNLANVWSWAPAWNATDTDNGATNGNLLDYSGNARTWNQATGTAFNEIDDTTGNNIPVGVVWQGGQIARPPIAVPSVGGSSIALLGVG